MQGQINREILHLIKNPINQPRCNYNYASLGLTVTAASVGQFVDETLTPACTPYASLGLVAIALAKSFTSETFS